MMTMGSLFDGIGGFPLAAVRNGITPLWASEIESFPIEVTKIRFPEMLHVGDITKLDGAALPSVDVICGGSPCQDNTEEIVIPKIGLYSIKKIDNTSLS
jgi:DNA (cytosine-5)-methyltransferase 1